MFGEESKKSGCGSLNRKANFIRSFLLRKVVATNQMVGNMRNCPLPRISLLNRFLSRRFFRFPTHENRKRKKLKFWRHEKYLRSLKSLFLISFATRGKKSARRLGVSVLIFWGLKGRMSAVMSRLNFYCLINSSRRYHDSETNKISFTMINYFNVRQASWCGTFLSHFIITFIPN